MATNTLLLVALGKPFHALPGFPRGNACNTGRWKNHTFGYIISQVSRRQTYVSDSIESWSLEVEHYGQTLRLTSVSPFEPEWLCVFLQTGIHAHSSVRWEKSSCCFQEIEGKQSTIQCTTDPLWVPKGVILRCGSVSCIIQELMAGH